MSKAKHTRGPWVYHSGMVWKPDGSEDGFPIARMDRETGSTIPTERDANARLIAAAPELLAACEALLVQIPAGAVSIEAAAAVNQAHAAIAKAETE